MDTLAYADRWRTWADTHWTGRASSTLEDDMKRWPPGTRLLHRDTPEYPAALAQLSHPPEFLYVCGRMPGGETVSMVGTREPDVEGERLAKRLSQGFVRAHMGVVSGGARGIDAACHRAALDAQGYTLAVLPSALDAPSPRQNASLFERIVEEGGGVMSEFPMGTPTRKHFFARRNALIAALGQTLVVVRARKEGGSWLTVEAAERLGKPIFAVPGSPEDPTATGCLELIRARRAEAAWDAAHCGAAPRPSAKQDAVHPVLEIVRGSGTTTIDDLVHCSNLSIQEVLRWVVEWELNGWVFREGPRVHAVL